jgi:hypothetical protein
VDHLTHQHFLLADGIDFLAGLELLEQPLQLGIVAVVVGTDRHDRAEPLMVDEGLELVTVAEDGGHLLGAFRGPVERDLVFVGEVAFEAGELGGLDLGLSIERADHQGVFPAVLEQ